MTERERIIEKIQKIKAHAESAERIGSEAEAEAFAEMMQKLLLRHKLEMTDIDFTKFEVEEPVEEHEIDYSKYDCQVKRARIAWIEQLAGIVARAHFCRILIHRGSTRITLVGRKSDCDVAEYMIITLQRLLTRLSIKARLAHNEECSKEGRKADIYNFRASYIRAFVERLSQRYEAERRSQEGSSSTALVRVNRAETAVKEFMAGRRYGRAAVVRGSRKDGNAEGLRRGAAAADSISLRSNAVGSDSVRGVLR